MIKFIECVGWWGTKTSMSPVRIIVPIDKIEVIKKSRDGIIFIDIQGSDFSFELHETTIDQIKVMIGMTDEKKSTSSVDSSGPMDSPQNC